jgi:hypothetical protein
VTDHSHLRQEPVLNDFGRVNWVIDRARAGATSIVGILPAIGRRALCRAGPGAFYKCRNDLVVPLICPTCQNVFAKFAQSIHAGGHHATLHGVVFDILVGSETHAGLGPQPSPSGPPSPAPAPVRLRFRCAPATPDTLRPSVSAWLRHAQPGGRSVVGPAGLEPATRPL